MSMQSFKYMNTEHPTLENESSQENSSSQESNQSSESSNENNQVIDSPETSTVSHKELDNGSENKENDQVSFQSDQTNQIADNEARLQQLETEHETLKSQYMRISADFDNFRKRQTRDHDDLKIQLTCTTLSEILPVVDNFERARQQLNPEGEEAQALHRSYQGLYKQLVEVLKQLGVAPMRVVDQSFDPTLHEAVLREPSDEKAEDIVTEELQRGYHLNGRVLRHALVKVSMGPGPKTNIKEVSDQTASPEEQNNFLEDSSKEEN